MFSLLGHLPIRPILYKYVLCLLEGFFRNDRFMLSRINLTLDIASRIILGIVLAFSFVAAYYMFASAVRDRVIREARIKRDLLIAVESGRAAPDQFQRRLEEYKSKRRQLKFSSSVPPKIRKEIKGLFAEAADERIRAAKALGSCGSAD